MQQSLLLGCASAGQRTQASKQASKQVTVTAIIMLHGGTQLLVLAVPAQSYNCCWSLAGRSQLKYAEGLQRHSQHADAVGCCISVEAIAAPQHSKQHKRRLKRHCH
jgi:hypothetical protein